MGHAYTCLFPFETYIVLHNTLVLAWLWHLMLVCNRLCMCMIHMWCNLSIPFTLDPSDIADGNLKLLLGILWRFIFKYHISANLKKPQIRAPKAESDLESDVDAGHTQSVMSVSKMLLAWFQASLPQFHITNFSRDWNDGVKLSALVNYCKPGLIPNWDQKDPDNSLENIRNAISLANEHFGIPEVIHAEDLAVDNPDRLAVMTYLGYFCSPGSPGVKVLLDWVEVVVPEVKISNFTSDWKDGEALCSLVAAFAPSAISRDDLDGKTNLEMTQHAMQVAQEQFDIKPFLTAEDFILPDFDQLSVMVYLTYFRFIKEERRKLPYLLAIGSGITGAQIGAEVVLQIEGEELDESIVEVRVRSPDMSEVKVQSRSGTPGFQYRPTVPGSYTVEVKYSGEHVRGSPYKVKHLPSLDSVTDGRGLSRACVGKEAEFSVDTLNLGEGYLNIRILDPDETPLDVVMDKEEESGVYNIKYTPLIIGEHKIDLEWYCNPDADEDTAEESVNALDASYTVSAFDVSKCIVMGSGLTHAELGQLASFQVNTAAVGKGSLSAFVNGPGNPDLHLVSIIDDVYSYEYVPTEGDLEFDLRWEMVPITGSPFKVTPVVNTPAMQCIIKEKPVDPIRACKPVSIVIVTPDTSSQLKGTLVGPGTNKLCDVSTIEENTYALSLFPIEVGTYEVHITYGGNPIPDSPVKFDVNDPSKCWVVNPEVLSTGSWQCGQQVLVRVATVHAGKGTLVGEVCGPSQNIASEIVEEEDGNRLVCFTPTEAGKHTIDFFFNGERFQKETNRITIKDDNLEGITITKPVSQTGYHQANKELDIWISAPGRDEKLFTVNACGVQTGAIPTCTLVPTGEDTYSIHFTASQPDDYRVEVKYNDKMIPGSPFTLSVRMPSCPEKVVSYDHVLPFKAGGDPIELVFNVKEAGVGTLTANVTDSSSDDWFQLVSIEEESQELYRVLFVPPKSDAYTVSVNWSGQPVPGSPFTINYKEQSVEPPVCIEFQPDEGSPGKLSATTHGANSGHVSTEIHQFKRGRYQISFLPPYRELYNLRVFWFEREIKGSPFVVDLMPAPPKTLPKGVHAVSLPVTAMRQSGIFSAFAIDKQSRLVRPLRLSFQKDYININFTDYKRDIYDLYVFWNQNLIHGSPFKIDLTA